MRKRKDLEQNGAQYNKKNKGEELDSKKSITFYHTTPGENASLINKDGLKTDKIGTGLDSMLAEEERPNDRVIYLAPTLKDVGVYFEMLEQDGLNPVVYQIDIIDSSRLTKDPGDSIAYRYHGNIPSSQLKKIQLSRDINYSDLFLKEIEEKFAQQPESKLTPESPKSEPDPEPESESESASASESPSTPERSDEEGEAEVQSPKGKKLYDIFSATKPTTNPSTQTGTISLVATLPR